jgi:hypothetical protein
MSQPLSCCPGIERVYSSSKNDWYSVDGLNATQATICRFCVNNHKLTNVTRIKERLMSANCDSYRFVSEINNKIINLSFWNHSLNILMPNNRTDDGYCAILPVDREGRLFIDGLKLSRHMFITYSVHCNDDLVVSSEPNKYYKELVCPTKFLFNIFDTISTPRRMDGNIYVLRKGDTLSVEIQIYELSTMDMTVVSSKESYVKHNTRQIITDELLRVYYTDDDIYLLPYQKMKLYTIKPIRFDISVLPDLTCSNGGYHLLSNTLSWINKNRSTRDPKVDDHISRIKTLMEGLEPPKYVKETTQSEGIVISSEASEFFNLIRLMGSSLPNDNSIDSDCESGTYEDENSDLPQDWNTNPLRLVDSSLPNDTSSDSDCESDASENENSGVP